MPITRSVWTDDDGTGTTGTVLNNSELQKIYNNIDAWGGGYADSIVVGGAGGTINDWVIPGMGTRHTMVTLTNGIPSLTITGIKAGVDGQRLTIRSHTGYDTFFFHNHTGSLDANRFSLSATSAGTPVSLFGYVNFIYNVAAARWLLIGHEQGAWITPPFNAANFGGGLVVTAGQVASNKYRLSGRTLHWSLAISGATITGTPTALSLAIPGGFTLAAESNMPIISALPTWGTSRCGAGSGSSTYVTKLDFSAFAAASGVYLQMNNAFEVT